jgi:carboxyl-terminal processing protease
MASKMKQASLIFVGLVAGVLISLNFQAIADRAARSPLPVEELRAFTEVFGAIKANYVETVEDKKLITEAINGMLSGLDPHSAYLDAEAFRELQVGTQGQFGGLGIEVGMEGRIRQGDFAHRGHSRVPRRRQAGRPDHQARRDAGERA